MQWIFVLFGCPADELGFYIRGISASRFLWEALPTCSSSCTTNPCKLYKPRLNREKLVYFSSLHISIFGGKKKKRYGIQDLAGVAGDQNGKCGSSGLNLVLQTQEFSHCTMASSAEAPWSFMALTLMVSHSP